MRPIKVGVVGVGHLGKHHARILAGMPHAELVGIADVSPSAKEIAKLYKVPAYSNYQTLAQQADALVLAVPTRFHHALGCPLLRSGKHLLIEKPLACTTAETEELVDLAKAAGVVLAVGHVERFNSALEAAGDSLQEVKYLEASRTSGYTFRSTDIGVVLDLMIHDIDLALSIVGEPVTKVEAFGVSIFGQHEDVAQARLTFADGCQATLNASRVSYSAGRTLQAWTPKAFVQLDLTSRQATVVQPDSNILAGRLKLDELTPEQREQCKTHLFDELLRKQTHTPEPCDQLTAELGDFLHAVQTSSTPRVDGLQGSAAVRVAERILRSIWTHAWDTSAPIRTGPFLATRPTSILRGPHWNQMPAQLPSIERRAG